MTTTEPDPALSRAPDPSTPQTRIWDLSDRAEMVAVRSQIATWLAPAVERDEPCCFDIELVVTELMTNAFDHGHGNWCSVVLGLNTDTVRCRVTSEVLPGSASLPPLDQWVMPGPGQLRGRGLAIVRRLASSVRFQVSGHLVTIKADVALNLAPALVSARAPAPSSYN